jgi:hypothetical protein
VEYRLELIPVKVLPSLESKPILDIKPDAPSPVIVDVSSTGSIMLDTYTFTPATVEFKMVVRPTLETNPAAPSPVILEASSTGSIIELMYVLRPTTEEMS